MEQAYSKKYVSWLMLAFALVVAGTYLSRPLFDNDFYWHLKTGQWIWQHKSLPGTDPFTIPPLPPPSPRTEFILSSYWLSQLILYGFYAVGGMSGIIVLRWILAGISFAICTRWANLRNSSVAAVMMFGSIQLLESYALERPQFISFICFGALLVILFSFLEHPDRWPLWRLIVSLSLLMIIWANMHGGFILGQAILTFCIIAERCKFLHPSLSPLTRRYYSILLVAAITALAVSFLNPNPFNSIKQLTTILGTKYTTDIGNSEYMNVIEYFKLYHRYIIVINIISMLLTAIVVMCSRHRTNLTWVGILLVTGYMGFHQIRYMPFFLISATTFSIKFFETECTSSTAKRFLYALLLATTIYFVGDGAQYLRSVVQHGWVPPSHYPTKAADFITTTGMNGNVFTSHDWGGYMIWRLGPENKIFCDGRQLDIDRIWEYLNSTVISSPQEPYWKILFDKYGIQTAVLPLFDISGKPLPLTQSVRMDKDWVMVFAQYNAAVFRRANFNTRTN